MTTRTSTRETPFSLAFGVEAIIPVEIGIPSFHIDQFRPKDNEAQLRMHLDMLEERRNTASLCVVAYQSSARFYNSNVKARRFSVGDLVL